MRIIAEGLARHIFNLSDIVSVVYATVVQHGRVVKRFVLVLALKYKNIRNSDHSELTG